jgi:hypothetical protein
MIASLSVVARVRAETGKRSGLGYVAEGPLGLLPMSSLGRSVSRKADGRAAPLCIDSRSPRWVISRWLSLSLRGRRALGHAMDDVNCYPRLDGTS